MCVNEHTWDSVQPSTHFKTFGLTISTRSYQPHLAVTSHSQPMVTKILFPYLYLDIAQILYTYMENWVILQKLSFFPLSPSSLRHIQLIMHSTVQTSYCWVIYEAVNIELVSSLGLLQIKLLWTFMYKLCENEVSFLWDGSLSVWLLVHFFF